MTLSIIIPCYNIEKYIERCLGSIFPQIEGREAEIVAIDDGSNDGTLSILREQEKRHPALRVFTQANAGPASARNRGVNLSKGHFCWFIDGDDYLASDAVEKLWPNLTGEFDIIAFNYSMKEADGIKKKSHYTDDIINAARLIMTGPSYSCTKVYRRVLFEYMQFPEGLINIEDLVFNLSLSPHVGKVRTLPDNLYVYERTNQASTSVNRGKRHLIRLHKETMIAHSLLIERRKNITERDLSRSYDMVLNRSFSGCIFSLMRLYNCRFVKRAIRIYTDWGVYPFKYAGNMKAKVFTFFINHKPLWLLSPLVRFIIPK